MQAPSHKERFSSEPQAPRIGLHTLSAIVVSTCRVGKVSQAAVYTFVLSAETLTYEELQPRNNAMRLPGRSHIFPQQASKHVLPAGWHGCSCPGRFKAKSRATLSDASCSYVPGAVCAVPCGAKGKKLFLTPLTLYVCCSVSPAGLQSTDCPATEPVRFA